MFLLPEPQAGVSNPIDILDFRPDVDLVAAAQAGLLDGAAGLFAAAVAAETEGLFTGARNDLAPVDRDRAICAFGSFLDRFQVDADLRNCVFHAA